MKRKQVAAGFGSRSPSPETRLPPRGYFDDSDEEQRPAAASTAPEGASDDESVDPLDAFMAGVEDEVKQEQESADFGKAKDKPEFLDDDDDPVKDYDEMIRGLAAEKASAQAAAKASAVDGGPADAFDDEGHAVRVPAAKKHIESLPPLDHSKIDYLPFQKVVYSECSKLSAMTPDQVAQARASLGVTVTAGRNAPAPLQSFEQANLPEKILAEISRQGFSKPTPIQAQALPVAMSGHDMIGVAKTGSGKTFSFVWPILCHLICQPDMKPGDGPIAVVLSPTRELATQIYHETKRYAKRLGKKVCAIVGGSGKWQMIKILKEERPEIVVATPGRMIEMIKLKATNMQRCTMFVLDEADRMFDMGFEYQMRSIVDQVRPDRQVLLFSATFKKRVEALARDILKDPVRINIGHGNLTSNEGIHQVIHVVQSDPEKWSWLCGVLPAFLGKGKLLIFVSSKAGCEQLCQSLQHSGLMGGHTAEALHGDKEQSEREVALWRFKHGHCAVLVGTDVASRGLDIKDIQTVVNYDAAKNLETHVHRIGRTGRMQKDGVHEGTAYTLLTKKQGQFASQLIPHLNAAHQPISSELRALAATGRHGGQAAGRYAAVPPPQMR
jgi:ATP-dependent RNA helicase DDX42